MPSSAEDARILHTGHQKRRQLDAKFQRARVVRDNAQREMQQIADEAAEILTEMTEAEDRIKADG